MQTIDIPMVNIEPVGQVAHIPAYYRGRYMAVHRELATYDIGNVRKDGMFCVTHIATGLWIRKYHSLVEARRIAKALDASDAWAFTSKAQLVEESFKVLAAQVTQAEQTST